MSLSPGERETLLLIAWDGLSTARAAAVAGCSPRTFAVRLHRARQRLDRAIATANGDRDPVPHPLMEETT